MTLNVYNIFEEQTHRGTNTWTDGGKQIKKADTQSERVKRHPSKDSWTDW